MRSLGSFSPATLALVSLSLCKMPRVDCGTNPSCNSEKAVISYGKRVLLSLSHPGAVLDIVDITSQWQKGGWIYHEKKQFMPLLHGK
jgi:hypothetical protein